MSKFAYYIFWFMNLKLAIGKLSITILKISLINKIIMIIRKQWFHNMKFRFKFAGWGSYCN